MENKKVLLGMSGGVDRKILKQYNCYVTFKYSIKKERTLLCQT